MIARSADWKHALATAVRDPAELLALLALPDSLLEGAQGAIEDFPLRVPRGFVARMQVGNPADPLLRQVLPLAVETNPVAGFNTDPVGDLTAQAGAGMLHKYHGRVLLTTTGACAIHCRYCFRRHFPYAEQRPAHDNWQGVVDYLQAHPEVDELILSGGDPLVLDNHQLHALSQRLLELPQLKRLRLHSRLPVVLPERVDSGLLAWLQSLPWPTVLVIHSNHPQELDDDVGRVLLRLRRNGTVMLNQSVLLAGVNDDVKTLATLSYRLFDCGVLPYYLHLLDRVTGAAHFETEHGHALDIYAALQDSLPGYLLPRLVREQTGDTCKRPVIG